MEQLFKADSPHLAGTITIEKAARGYSIRLWTLFGSRVIVGFISNFLKNLKIYLCTALNSLVWSNSTEISWWVLSSLEWRFHRLRNFGRAQTFSVFFLRVFAKFLLKIDKFDEILVGISSGRRQILIGIIHPDHTECIYPSVIDPDYWGPHWYRFWTPLRKNVRNLYIHYIEGGGGPSPVWNSLGSSILYQWVIISLTVDLVGRANTILTVIQLLGEEIFVETYSKSPYFADFECGKNSSSKFFLSLGEQIWAHIRVLREKLSVWSDFEHDRTNIREVRLYWIRDPRKVKVGYLTYYSPG